MTNEPGTSRGRSAVRLFGIVGLVLCLVLAVGILIGRSWLAGQVDGVFDSLDQAVSRGSTIVVETNGRLQERVADLDTMLTDISALPATASITRDIADRGAAIADRFSQIREGWVAIRARIDAALETLAQVDRALPFVDLPTGPTEELAALDQRFAEIETNVARLRAGVSARVQEIVDVGTTIRGAVGRVAEAGARVEAGLAAVQERIDRARSNVETLMWLTTAALLLLVAYIALLNYLLIRGYGRGRSADAAAPVVVDEPT